MAHCFSETAEKILDKEFKVLNKGFVRLVDYYGTDTRIVQAARVSYGAGTKSVSTDRDLIHYLLRNGHTSPFEQVVITFHIKLPIFIARQFIRHRTARVNEISGRYSVLKPEFYVPDESTITHQNKDNKQGRDVEPCENTTDLIQVMVEDQENAYKNYEYFLSENMAREIARINLPLSLYTEWYWQIDLHNLFNFLRLRLDNHAQLEIREYAKVIYNISQTICPIACEAFEEHIMENVTFTKTEKKALQYIFKGSPKAFSWSDPKLRKRFTDKIRKIIED